MKIKTQTNKLNRLLPYLSKFDSYCEVAKNKPQAEKKRNDIPLKQ